MTCGTYKIKNNQNGKFYIGGSTQIERRWSRHLRDLRLGEHHSMFLQDEYDKYGEDSFELEIIEVCATDILKQKEQELLDILKPPLNVSPHATCGDLISHHPNRDEIVASMSQSLQEHMDSLTPSERKLKYGSPGKTNPMYGKTHTENSLQAMSDANKGNQHAKGSKRSPEQRKLLSELASKRTGKSNPFYGKEHSEKTKQKISKANKGKKPVNRRKVNVQGAIYDSVTDAAKDLGLVPGTIVYRCKSSNYSDHYYVD